eukprot:2498253-Rhodomonas_salina.1
MPTLNSIRNSYEPGTRVCKPDAACYLVVVLSSIPQVQLYWECIGGSKRPAMVPESVSPSLDQRPRMATELQKIKAD